MALNDKLGLYKKIFDLKRKYKEVGFNYFKDDNGIEYLMYSTLFKKKDYKDIAGIANFGYPMKVAIDKFDTNKNKYIEVASLYARLFYDATCGEISTLDAIKVRSNEDKNHGFASRLLEMYENSVLNNGIHHISGFLLSEKPEDLDKTRKFYEKNNYNFTFYPKEKLEDRLLYKVFNDDGTIKTPEELTQEDKRQISFPYIQYGLISEAYEDFVSMIDD